MIWKMIYYKLRYNMSKINLKSITEFAIKNTLTSGLYVWYYVIGNLISSNPEFKPFYYKGVNIIRVWISKRKIEFANHWLLYLS